MFYSPRTHSIKYSRQRLSISVQHILTAVVFKHFTVQHLNCKNVSGDILMFENTGIVTINCVCLTSIPHAIIFNFQSKLYSFLPAPYLDGKVLQGS